MTSTSKRRRFQAPITTFFSPSTTASSSSSSSSNDSDSTSHPLHAPELPHQIQSSLLTVGMRVRKSVPEGYKTVSKAPLGTSYTSSYDNIQAELAPYCGILKTGNLAVQPMYDPVRGIDDSGFFGGQKGGLGMGSAGDDQPDSLPSSQESNLSVNTQTRSRGNGNAAKRTMDAYLVWDDDDDGENDEEWKVAVQGGLTAYPVSHTRMPNLTTIGGGLNRTIAVPKSRLKKRKFVWKGAADGGAGMDGQENNAPAETGMDFEEADFLRDRWEVDDDVEMDIS